MALSVQSGLPWEGRSTITVSTTADVRATVKLRIPGWTVNRPVPGQLYALRLGIEVERAYLRWIRQTLGDLRHRRDEPLEPASAVIARAP